MKQSGFSIIELMVVVGLVALMAAAVWAFAPRVDKGRDEAQLVADILALQDEVRSVYEGQMDYSAVSVADLVARGTTPARLTDRATGLLRTSWGGAITLTPDVLAGDTGAATGTAVSLRLSVLQLTAAERIRTCLAVMPQLAPFFTTTYIGGVTTGQTVQAGQVDVPNPSLRAAIDTQCRANLTSDPTMGGSFL